LGTLGNNSRSSASIAWQRRIDNVRVDVERHRDARVSQLLLRDLHRHAQIVQGRRVNVTELMPRHSPEARGSRRWLQDVLQQLRFASRLTVAIPEQKIVRSGARVGGEFLYVLQTVARVLAFW
jgi:hypothetical protein